MMISPNMFVDEYKDKPYTELIEIRDNLIAEIKSFEANKDNSTGFMIEPSPEVVYQCNLQYLGKLCELIADKYNQEYVWGTGDEQ